MFDLGFDVLFTDTLYLFDIMVYSLSFLINLALLW